MEIDNLIEQLHSLILDEDTVRFNNPTYRTFHEDLTKLIYKNHLQCQSEWSTISNNLVYYSNQKMVLEEANLILGQLELLKRKMLSRAYEPMWEYIHRRIKEVSLNSFITGEHANAVEFAFKEIEVRVKHMYKTKTGLENSGVSLMRDAFTFKRDKGTKKITTYPVLVFEEMDTGIWQDVQEGYMQLLAGAMQGIRNPKAHTNMNLDEKQAMHRLMFASLLMYKLDDVEND